MNITMLIIGILIGAIAGAVIVGLFMKADFERRREEDRVRQQEDNESMVALVKSQLLGESEKIMKERKAELDKENLQQMNALIQPLKLNMDNISKALNETRSESTRHAASFEQQMKLMMEQTVAMGEKADRISNVLQHNNKLQGNFGELILSNILEAQGLTEGREFTTQQVLADNMGNARLNEVTGKKLMPDVVLHLSHDRDVIIDSKMVVEQYQNYLEAKTEDERKKYAAEHLQAIRNHIRSLSSKNYSQYVSSHKSIDFIIMFIPFDGAIQLMMHEAPALWRETFDKDRIFIAGPQTLIAACKIIDLTWRQIKQERNAEEIMKEAAVLVDRVRTFYDRFKDFGNRLADAQKSYDAICTSVEGRQGILGAGKKMNDLGVKGNKTLPAIEK